MGVIVVKKQRPWYSNVGVNLGSTLLDNVIGGMFKRDAEAKAATRRKALYGDMGDAMQPQTETKSYGFDAPENDYGPWSDAVQSTGITNQKPTTTMFDEVTTRQPGRSDMLRVLGKHGATADEAKTFSEMYKDRFKVGDDLYRGDAVRDRIGELNFDVRNNPNEAMRSGIATQDYGLKPQEIMKYAYPNMTSDNFDAGDREVMYSFDPGTGKFSTQEQKYGINPTKRYETDSDVKRAGITAGAQRYVADRGAESRMYVADRGLEGKQTGGSAKPLSISDKKNLDAMIAQAIQLAISPEDFNARIQSIAGDNPQIQEYVAVAARNPQYMYKNNVGFYETKQNPYATPTKGPSIPELASKILAGANGDVKQAIAGIDGSQKLSEAQKAQLKKVLMKQ